GGISAIPDDRCQIVFAGGRQLTREDRIPGGRVDQEDERGGPVVRWYRAGSDSIVPGHAADKQRHTRIESSGDRRGLRADYCIRYVVRFVRCDPGSQYVDEFGRGRTDLKVGPC